jgi:hypothetical protein
MTQLLQFPSPPHLEASPGFTVLDSEIFRDPRWCANCGGTQTFVEVYEFESGRVGFCLGCGEEKTRWFTRTVGEAS